MILDLPGLSNRERYQLLTSLVVPRPIAWVSTRSHAGAPNIAPFSYFAALSSTPFLVGFSAGSRAGHPKDTLRNIRETGGFCINVSTAGQLDQLNLTAGEYGPEVDEFAHAGLPVAWADLVHAPFVADCPAALECRLFREVPLDPSTSTLVIGEVLRIHLAEGVLPREGTYFLDHEVLDPVSRLWGDHYALLGEIRTLARPKT